MISYINVHLHLHLHSSKTGHSTFVLSTIDVLVLLYWDSLTGSVCQLPVVVLSTKERNELLLGPDTLMDADILCIQLTYSRARGARRSRSLIAYQHLLSGMWGVRLHAV